jgi:hypothetical protein
MDNAKIHHGEEIVELIESFGVYLVVYMSDLFLFSHSSSPLISKRPSVSGILWSRGQALYVKR